MVRHLLRAGAGCLLAQLILAACAKSQPGASSLSNSAGDDGGANLDGGGLVVYGPGDAPVTSITVTPLDLVPSFSPDVHDYYVRCADGDNELTIDVTDASGSVSRALHLTEDQVLVVADQYWIRCLPHDFPEIDVARPSGAAPTPGYFLVNTTTYAMVLDVRATPVWYARGTSVDNVDAPRANVLSLMPAATAPFGTSPTADFELHALDTATTTYVRAFASPTDGHELRLLPDGNYLLFTYPIESGVDLTGLSTFGEDEYMADCEIQEVDASGRAVWSWLASEHIDPVAESLEPHTSTIAGHDVRDVFHCNSIEVDAKGNLLVSIRQMNALVYIDKSTGKIVWKLGGSPTNKDGAQVLRVVGDPQGTFNLQHDARFRPNGNVTLFDDHGAGSGVARGVEYAIDFGAGTATLAWQFLGRTQSQYEGSFRRYDDGESVIGWGGAAPDARVITEVDANGSEVLDVSFTPIAAPYRAVKVPLATLDIASMRLTAAKW
jgi:hypothetical protein